MNGCQHRLSNINSDLHKSEPAQLVSVSTQLTKMHWNQHPITFRQRCVSTKQNNRCLRKIVNILDKRSVIPSSSYFWQNLDYLQNVTWGHPLCLHWHIAPIMCKQTCQRWRGLLANKRKQYIYLKKEILLCKCQEQHIKAPDAWNTSTQYNLIANNKLFAALCGIYHVIKGMYTQEETNSSVAFRGHWMSKWILATHKRWQFK